MHEVSEPDDLTGQRAASPVSDNDEDSVEEVEAWTSSPAADDQLKPLMRAHRRRSRSLSSSPRSSWHWPRWSVCRCIACWTTVTSALVVGAIVVALAAMTSLPDHVIGSEPLPVEVGCGKLSVEDVWVSGFAKLMTESALRLVDVNRDGVLDVLLGFATGRLTAV